MHPAQEIISFSVITGAINIRNIPCDVKLQRLKLDSENEIFLMDNSTSEKVTTPNDNEPPRGTNGGEKSKFVKSFRTPIFHRFNIAIFHFRFLYANNGAPRFINFASKSQLLIKGIQTSHVPTQNRPNT